MFNQFWFIKVDYERTRFSFPTFTVEVSDTVEAGAAVIAGLLGTVVNVLAAVTAGPAVHTDTHEATRLVDTRPTIVADRGLLQALVYINITEFTCEKKK